MSKSSIATASMPTFSIVTRKRETPQTPPASDAVSGLKAGEQGAAKVPQPEKAKMLDVSAEVASVTTSEAPSVSLGNITKPATPVEDPKDTSATESTTTAAPVPKTPSQSTADVQSVSSADPLNVSGYDIISLARPMIIGRGIHRPSFSGKDLDTKKAARISASVGHSPVTPDSQAPSPTYHYPGPDILTKENQEILNLIIRGPIKKEVTEELVLAGEENSQPIVKEFYTRPKFITYDGKDAYEVLGDRYPRPLTLRDHPHLNKFLQKGKVFACAYCHDSIPATTNAEGLVICPGCGPCSDVRYCKKSHLLADSMTHAQVCGTTPANYPLSWEQIPPHYALKFPYIKPPGGPMTMQCFRQMAYCLIVDSDGIIESPFKAYFEVSS